ALLLCVAHGAAYGSETRQNVAVCLKLETLGPHSMSTLAGALATRICARVGIPLEWTACEPAVGCSPTPIVVQLVSRTPGGFMSGVLGYAMPDRSSIVIFFDRIEMMLDSGTVLGHVMVHEITHVIQGVCRHSRAGLMKPHWSSRDLMEMRCN